MIVLVVVFLLIILIAVHRSHVVHTVSNNDRVMGRKPHPAFRLFQRQPGQKLSSCKACGATIDHKRWQAAAQHTLYVCESVSIGTRHLLQQELAARNDLQKVPKPQARTIQRAAQTTQEVAGDSADDTGSPLPPDLQTLPDVIQVSSNYKHDNTCRASCAASWPERQAQSEATMAQGVYTTDCYLLHSCCWLLQAELQTLNCTCPVQRQQPGASSSAAAPRPPPRRPRMQHKRMLHTSRFSPETQQGASSNFTATGGHTAEALAWAETHCMAFQAAAADLVEGLRSCGWCGRSALGGEHSQLGTHWRCIQQAELPPAVLHNPAAVTLVQNTRCDRVGSTQQLRQSRNVVPLLQRHK